MTEQSPSAPRPTCQAQSEDGSPCPRPAVPGSSFCERHVPKPQPNLENWLAVEDLEMAQALRKGANGPVATAQSGSKDESVESSARPVGEEPCPRDYPPTDEGEPSGLHSPLPKGTPASPDSEGFLAVDDRLTTAQSGDPQDGEQHSQLQEELTRFAHAAQQLVPPGYEIPDFSNIQGRAWLQEVLGPLYPRIAHLIDTNLERGYLSADVWKGMWAVATYLLHAQARTAARRLAGDYVIDDYGLDEEFLDVVMPLVRFLYRTYWRVEVSGLEHVPTEDRALLVSNHSGVLPFDGAMISAAIHSETDGRRLPRSLISSWFPTLPFISMLLQKTGQVVANPHNAQHLLEHNELVIVFPEGYKGAGKLFKNRYQLARFGRGGFIRIAVSTRAPIIPVAVVGAEEIYPMMGRSQLLARLLKMPYFPITPTWPWLGLLGLVPLPSKWTIDFAEPILVQRHGPRAAANPALISRLTEEVRSTIQQMLWRRLAQRRSVFLG